ncbi:response regulator transcription factor [Niabella ginsengisoli]|uniref:Response regulator n=1 Tax=Niabella ginsengisoli TaxID=522298 RepID=A0ABS9SQZ0_9BACT|nr:helix-turn-helix domain-containing protein [Niabella ginsengisoli]MCH5600787.1 response regulator [Niabella ginsengisoli]
MHESKSGIGADFIVTIMNIETNNVGIESPQQNMMNEDYLQNKFLYLPKIEESTERLTLLLVEDNDDIRNYVSSNLSEPYSVIEATNGTEGFEKAISAIPDLIISDIMMPGMNGLELCKKLKTDQNTSHIPVVLLTARKSDQYEAEGYETGADAYIAKPFSMPLLQVRIRNLIESRTKLRELFGQSPESYTNPVGLNAADKSFLTRAVALIEENMADAEVNVEWLANQLFMSRTQLYRKIKAISNQSVHEFVTDIRLSKAARLLLEGGHSVTEIAFMVGYADATSFGRMFQKRYGTTPKKYSQQDNTSNS